MALTELFGSNYGLICGVQGRIISGVTTLTITGISVNQSGTDGHKVIIVTFTADGNNFELNMEFWDETYQARTISGGAKNVNQV